MKNYYQYKKLHLKVLLLSVDDIEITGGCLWRRLASNRQLWKKKGAPISNS